MRFPYHDSHDGAFEKLVLEICHGLLGTVHGFSSGKDGGRDARFAGTANQYPSQAKPYEGKFVIQAKHTEDPCAKTGDASFSSPTNKTSVIEEELPRIKALVAGRELDHYLLFTNRRNGAIADAAIRKRVIDEAGVQSVGIFGIEDLDRFLARDPKLLDLAGMSELRSPLRVTPDDLAVVITSLASRTELFKVQGPIRRTDFKQKNLVNNLSPSFAKIITRDYLPYTHAVDDFLGHPDNTELAERYDSAALEFNEMLIAYRDPKQPFDQQLVTLQKLLFDRDSDLARSKKLTKLVLYTMYWNCDLGETE